MLNYSTALICACASNEDAFVNAVKTGLKPDAFTDPDASKVWDALYANFSEGLPHSKVELDMRMREMYGDGAEDTSNWLSLATAEVGDLSPAEKWLEHTASSWMARRKQEALAEITELASEGIDATEIARYLADKLAEIDDSTQLEEQKAEKMRKEVADHNSARIRGEGGLITTGIDFVDHQCGRLKTHEFVVMASRPGGGKSSFARELLMGPVKSKKQPTLLFSLEMPIDEVILCLASTNCGVPANGIEDDFEANQKKLDQEQRRFASTIGKFLLMHEFTTDIREIERLTALEVRRHRPALVVIDYLQLVRAPHLKVSREQEVAYISGRLKMMANIHRIPVIALCQLNRLSVNEDREPRASDLRESGSLEQDADAIWLLHKPKEPKRNGLVEERKFIQEKRRGGSVCDFSIGFIGKTTKFVFSPVEEQKEWKGDLYE